MSDNILGWDIGGAHLKVALIERKTNTLTVYQQPCELWKGLEKLEYAVQQILAQIPGKTYRHVLTMTGELVDLFANRDDGVAQIIAAMQRFLTDQSVLIYAGNDGFLTPEAIISQYYSNIASANWLASATWAARKINNGLLVDVGSTTTDVLWLQDGQVNNKGYSDYERLISQELLYTGIVRTPVMAVTQFASDQGKRVGLMAEYFATMADVYRLTGELDGHHDQTTTADGGEKTVAASAKRLARMIGCDFYASELARWRQFAQDLRTQQMHNIQQACLMQLKQAKLNTCPPLVGAGIGRFLVKALAVELKLPYIDFTELVQDFHSHGDFSPADCAPAVAVALLVD